MQPCHDSDNVGCRCRKPADISTGHGLADRGDPQCYVDVAGAVSLPKGTYRGKAVVPSAVSALSRRDDVVIDEVSVYQLVRRSKSAQRTGIPFPLFAQTVCFHQSFETQPGGVERVGLSISHQTGSCLSFCLFCLLFCLLRRPPFSPPCRPNRPTDRAGLPVSSSRRWRPAKTGCRSAAGIERAEGRMTVASVRREDTGYPDPRQRGGSLARDAQGEPDERRRGGRRWPPRALDQNPT
jgi:hypothetical protein